MKTMQLSSKLNGSMEDKRVDAGIICYARRRGELSEGSRGYTRTPLKSVTWKVIEASQRHQNRLN